MNQMLRQDGTVTIYMIQHWEVPRGIMSKGGPGKWVFSCLGHFGTPPGFSASDECWQRYGHYGVLTLEEAKAGLEWIANRPARRIPFDRDNQMVDNRDYRFRVVAVTLSQQTVPVLALDEPDAQAA